MTPGRLAAPATADEVRQLQQQRWWMVGQRVAADCQLTSPLAGIWEATPAPAVQRGRISELAGLMAGGGEQFALALAALAGAELWNIHRLTNLIDPESVEGRVLDAAEEMVQRAMAELASYYLLAVGHTVAFYKLGHDDGLARARPDPHAKSPAGPGVRAPAYRDNHGLPGRYAQFFRPIIMR